MSNQLSVTSVTPEIQQVLQEYGWKGSSLGIKVDETDTIRMIRLCVEKEGLKLDLQAVIQEDPDLPIYIGCVTVADDFNDETFDDIDSIQSSPTAVLIHLIKQLP